MVRHILHNNQRSDAKKKLKGRRTGVFAHIKPLAASRRGQCIISAAFEVNIDDSAIIGQELVNETFFCSFYDRRGCTIAGRVRLPMFGSD
jgi:hypothetical protein